MPFFTAVMAADGDGWRARDVDVEDAADLDDLASTLRTAAHHDGTVLAVIEAEDQWFALVRVDDDDSARIFVSDLTSATAGHYGPIVSAAADVDVEGVSNGAVPVAAAADRDDEAGSGGGSGDDDEGPSPVDGLGSADDDDEVDVELIETPDDDEEPVAPWAGDPTLLEDYGVDAATMIEMVEENPDDPSTVLADLGEQVGFADLIEALR